MLRPKQKLLHYQLFDFLGIWIYMTNLSSEYSDFFLMESLEKKICL